MSEFTKPEIIRVYDSDNEQDREDAKQLIGFLVGIPMQFSKTIFREALSLVDIQHGFRLVCGHGECGYDHEYKYICEFSNSRPKQPEFYCAANIDQVPDDAIGKEWEFGADDAKYWYKYTLQHTHEGLFTVLNNGITLVPRFFFMRPIQPKPVKRMSAEEAAKELSLNYNHTFKQFVMTKEYVENRIVEKLGYEVVIDE